MVCVPAALLLEANPGDRVVDEAAVGSLPEANPGDRVVCDAAAVGSTPEANPGDREVDS